MGQDWKGGDVVRFPGGGHKVNLLKPVVEQWKDEKNTVIMFVDRCVQSTYYFREEGVNISLSLSLSLSYSYDVIFTGGANLTLSKFKDFNSRVVFSAEGFCWPDRSLAVSSSLEVN